MSEVACETRAGVSSEEGADVTPPVAASHCQLDPGHNSSEPLRHHKP